MTRRERISVTAAHLTGSEGPLRSLLDRLRMFGLGERVLKTAIAVALSWELAGLIPGNSNPVLAAMTGMFSINLTIASSVTDAVQRILGVIWGVAVALLVNWAFGLSGWSLGLVVLISFVGGRRLRLEASGLSQMAVSALLVVLGAVGTEANNVAVLHFVNTLIGTLVGILLNAAVAPPNYLPAARLHLQNLGDRIAEILDDLAGGLANGIAHETAWNCLQRARVVATTLDEVDASIKHAEESLKYHVLARRQLTMLAVYRRSSRALEHTAVQSRVICRSIVDIVDTAAPGEPRPTWVEPEVLGGHLANLLSAVAISIEHFVSLVDAPRHSDDDEALAGEVQNCRRDVTLAARDHLTELLPDGWTLLGEVIAISGQLVTDLSDAANDLEGLPNWTVRTRPEATPADS
ncbi:MAG: hypothetical protein QOF73_2048 [Thermomicrobiales bacterium]|nr:hypothetical protein [Thermomicrobiales bacterium]